MAYFIPIEVYRNVTLCHLICFSCVLKACQVCCGWSWIKVFYVILMYLFIALPFLICFFSDGTVSFAKAYSIESQVILNVLKPYKNALGQQVSFSKTHNSFSLNTAPLFKIWLRDFLM